MRICSVSLDQALGIWSDLWRAYYGENGFGGDTAEIYSYRLHGQEPCLSHAPCPDGPGLPHTMQRYAWETYQGAAQNLASLLYAFQDAADCRVEIDGQPLVEWDNGVPLIHRCHVKVIPKG